MPPSVVKIIFFVKSLIKGAKSLMNPIPCIWTTSGLSFFNKLNMPMPTLYRKIK